MIVSSINSTEPDVATRATTHGAARPWYADRTIRAIIAVSIALAGMTFIAAQHVAQLPQGPGGMRSFPRMPLPPSSPEELLRALGVGSLLSYGCFLAAPLLAIAGRRFPIAGREWPLKLLAHLLLVGLFAMMTAFLQYRVTYDGAPLAPALAAYLKVATLTGTLPFLTVAAIVHALDARSRAHERSLEAERVRSQLAESRLAALTAQLQPHFLFNTLQGISTLITHDPAGADAMLSNLSDLLREVLRRGDQREVELQEELRVLEPYLEISRRRFGSRLRIVVSVDDDTRRALVPFFILQPLVENALHHGISSHAGDGCISIRACRVAGTLALLVTDDGPGVVTPDSRRGIGLTNTIQRLREFYGDDHDFQAVRPAGGGFEVRVTLPLRVRSPAVEEGAPR